MNNIDKYIFSAEGRIKPDLVLKNAWVVNVFTQSIHKDDLAITGDRIIGIGKYSGMDEIDCEGLYAVPGFIDAHVHIESSKVVPAIFSSIVIKKGVTTCIADPHEIANVLGEEGIRFMIENSRKGVIDTFFMVPSCVPAVEYEDNGASLDDKVLDKFKVFSEVLGLGEVMDVPSVINMEDSMSKKLYSFRGRVIDGHCPHICNEWLNAYLCAGIRTDHECTTPEEAIEKIKRGMYVMLREGSAARNLKKLLPAVNSENYQRFLFCTDDKDITDLSDEGSIDHNIRESIRYGLNPIKAITMATLNPSLCYNLRDRGALAPGYMADIILLNNLDDISIRHIIRKGKLYEGHNNIPSPLPLPSSVKVRHINEEMLKIAAKSNRVNVIKIIKNTIETEKTVRTAVIKDSYVAGIASDDFLKAAVFERHKMTGKYAVCFIEGLELHNCSIAQTIAHDSHNIIAVGDSDSDISAAVNRVIDLNGGIAVVSSGNIIGEISLPAGGLMSWAAPDTVIESLKALNSSIKRFQSSNDGSIANIFLTLSFLSLPVVPEIKLTARGLFDYTKQKFISMFYEEYN